jgi:hypothetical protein
MKLYYTINTLDYGTVQVTDEYYFNDNQVIDTIEMDNGSYYDIYEHNNTYYARKLPE